MSMWGGRCKGKNEGWWHSKGPALSVLLLAVLAGQLTAEVLVSDAYVRGLPPGQPVTAAFMSLENRAAESLDLVSVSSDVAGRAEIHRHIQRSGMMRMEKVDRISLPVGEVFQLQPGGHHLMLFDLQRSLKDGEQVLLTFDFSDGSSQTISMPVRSVLNEHHNHNRNHHHNHH